MAACQNVEVNETLSINWEDPNPRVLWDGGAPIGESSPRSSCGHCVTVCPCNALMEKTMLGHAGFFTSLRKATLESMIDVVKGVEPETGYGAILYVPEIESKMRQHRVRRTKTVCTYCGVGCSFDVLDERSPHPQNCPRARPSQWNLHLHQREIEWGHINSPDRLTTPLIRENGKFRSATWDEALALIARRFSEIKAQSGPDSLGFISSSKCTNEESFLMQKLARAVIGTNNMDNCSRYCQAPATVGLLRTVGYGGDSGSIGDIARAAAGDDRRQQHRGEPPGDRHPREELAQAERSEADRLRYSRARNGAASRHLSCIPKPGTDLFWISAVSRYLLDNNLANRKSLDEWVNGLEEFRKSLEPFTMQAAAEITGLSEETLTTVAKIIAQAKRMCILWAMGVTQHSHGSI